MGWSGRSQPVGAEVLSAILVPVTGFGKAPGGHSSLRTPASASALCLCDFHGHVCVLLSTILPPEPLCPPAGDPQVRTHLCPQDGFLSHQQAAPACPSLLTSGPRRPPEVDTREGGVSSPSLSVESQGLVWQCRSCVFS